MTKCCLGSLTVIASGFVSLLSGDERADLLFHGGRVVTADSVIEVKMPRPANQRALCGRGWGGVLTIPREGRCPSVQDH
ncbi:MAG: hypothetical protein M2R45_01035 [Verrucomicrobia subdivision 3 bacterium]|nr:hypothetical protein [Limisphaerales bacterium]MCS1414147.1 hypothetical protein [Limisphaerales bacterium]